MKKFTKIICLALLVITSVFMSSCQEETVQPSDPGKEGNITGTDDWQKHNV
jgi:hypothetical protein